MERLKRHERGDKWIPNWNQRASNPGLILLLSCSACLSWGWGCRAELAGSLAGKHRRRFFVLAIGSVLQISNSRYIPGSARPYFWYLYSRENVLCVFLVFGTRTKVAELLSNVQLLRRISEATIVRKYMTANGGATHSSHTVPWDGFNLVVLASSYHHAIYMWLDSGSNAMISLQKISSKWKAIVTIYDSILLSSST
jgi:hypothetical protein